MFLRLHSFKHNYTKKMKKSFQLLLCDAKISNLVEITFNV